MPEAANQTFASVIRGEKALVQSALNTKPGLALTDFLSKKVSTSPTKLESAVNDTVFKDSNPTLTEYGKEILPTFAEKGPLPFIAGLGLTALDFTGTGGVKNSIKTLTGLKDEASVLKILTKSNVSLDIAKEYAPIIARTSDEGEVLKIVSHIEELQKTTKISTSKVSPYKGEKDLTTKILKDLEGKTTVSKQYILDATNRGELKQVERDLIRSLVEKEGKDVNVADFAKKVKAELLPLKVKNSDLYTPEGKGKNAFRMVEEGNFTPKYENISLPDDVRGNVAHYRENIYESPIATSAGDTHFNYTTKNYFGHTRIEDMADNKTRRVIEVQSDLYQKGNLEKEGLGYKNVAEYNKDYPDQNFGKADRQKIQDAQKLQQYNDPTAHFRMVREEIKKAAQDGKTKLQFPTGETAMKIEGLGEDGQWAEVRNGQLIPRVINGSDLQVGKVISNDSQNSEWIITDVLGDGKFKAIPKSIIDDAAEQANLRAGLDSGTMDYNDAIKYFDEHGIQQDPTNPRQRARLTELSANESFDISGKVDTNNPIYKFYEKDVQKYLNKFGGKKITDEKGVSWFEVPIKKEMGNMPVEAFGAFAGVEVDEDGNVKINPETALLGLGITAGSSALRKSKKSAPQGNQPKQNPTTELGQSQLANQNLARAVAKQDPIPTNSKVISYNDSITKPLVNKQEVKEALNQFEINDGGLNTITAVLKPKTLKNPTLVAGAETLKDISGFKGQARDVYRNFKAFFGKNLDVVKKEILDPFDASKGKFVDEVKSIATELKTKIVDGLGIKKNTKESAALMDFGEKLITKDDLIKSFGLEKANKIEEADKWFRNKYDTFIDEVNEIRAKIYPNNPDKQIPKRQDYYRHYQELGGLDELKNIFETPAGIDPAIAGITAFTKPKSKFLSFAQRRLGLQSKRDAVGGFLEYIPSFSYAKHIDPQIGKFRTLASDLAIQTKESKNANNFIEYLNDFANDLAGKTSAADRFVQKIIPGGRKTFGVINWINKRVKANTILGNASSSLAQFASVPAGVASAKLYSVPGVLRTVGSIFAENKPMLQSSFIKERYMNSVFNQFDEGVLANTKQFAVWMLTVGDELGTKFIWNSHYAKGLANNVENPVKYADDVTRSIVAGRGIGEVPLLQKSKLFQVFAPFQLEVGNLWYVMGDMVKAKDFGGIATLFIANYLFNRVAEKIRGSDVTFDPMNAVYEGIMSLQQEENKKKGSLKLGGRVAGEVLSNIPGGQTLASMYPEYGMGILGGLTREQLFGEGDPTRYGGGLFAAKGLKDPLFKVIPPYGGSQIKKTIEGTGAFLKGRVTDAKGKTKFNIEQTPVNLVRSILFGKYSSPEAQESFDKVEEVSPEEQRLRPVYDEAQKLKANGRLEDAVELVNDLSKEDQTTYTKIKNAELKKQKEAITPDVLKIYKEAQILKAEGKDEEAVALVSKLSTLEQEVYKSLKTKYNDTKLSDLLSEDKPKKTSEKGFIKDVITYAQAIGTDPVTAFNRIFTGQKIKRVDNGAIIVERISLDESQSIKKNRGATSSMRLDHIIPLQLGGSNNENNLKLVSEEDWKSYTPIENKLGKLLKSGKISKKEAQKLIREFKDGKIKAEDILKK